MAGSKNNPNSKGGSQKSIVVLSEICEKCNDKCGAGIKYIQLLAKGKAGHGVVCQKLKELYK